MLKVIFKRTRVNIDLYLINKDISFIASDIKYNIILFLLSRFCPEQFHFRSLSVATASCVNFGWNNYHIFILILR